MTTALTKKFADKFSLKEEEIINDTNNYMPDKNI